VYEDCSELAALADKTHWMRIALTLTPMLVLSACGRPHPLAEWDPDAFAPPSPSESWSTSWWPDGFNEPAPMTAATLRPLDVELPTRSLPVAAAVDLALRVNPDTRGAWADARAAAAEYGISRGAWYPTLTLWAEAMYEQSLFPLGGPVNIQRVDQFEAGPSATLTWTLLDFGRREAADDEALRLLTRANLRFNRSIQDLVFDVQRGFFALEAAQGLREAADQDFMLASTVVRATEEKLMLGLATMPELLTARQASAAAGYAVQVADTAIHDAQTDLLVAIGLPPGTDLAFDTDASTPVPAAIAPSVEQLAALAMAVRPDLAAAAADVQAAEAAVAAAEATLNPTVDFAAGVGYDYLDYSLTPFGSPPGRGNGWNATWNVGLIGSWMLFDGEIRHNEIRLAKAERAEAVEALRRAQLDASGEVWDAYFDYQAASKRFDWARSLEESSIEQLEASQAAYDFGLGTLPDLLAAQRTTAQARAVRIQGRADVLIAAAAMAHATGDVQIR